MKEIGFILVIILKIVMKKKFYLPLIALLFIFSCETDEIKEIDNKASLEDNVSKRGANNGILLNYQDHKEMLARNSFIVGELMRLDSNDKNYVFSSLNSSTNSVLMSDLFTGQNSSMFLRHYKYLAQYAIINYEGCRDIFETVTTPDSQPWPPRQTPVPYPAPETDSAQTSPMVLSLINNLIFNNTEIVIQASPNPEDIYTVGHPLNANSSNLGTFIYDTPTIYIPRGKRSQRCAVYSEEVIVDNSTVDNNRAIVLSRPNLSNGNPYSYVNFDVNTFLSNLGNTNLSKL
ncbi:hypothetical protein [Nonlabens dokdonensis]|uniref:hypothetical protein n=1 Tax=Nonlabens dokdonensis TaxID=328515 RepID=UPI0026F1F270|nr:hypothetical protein [Nonlabens dokdonensis]